MLTQTITFVHVSGLRRGIARRRVTAETDDFTDDAIPTAHSGRGAESDDADCLRAAGQP